MLAVQTIKPSAVERPPAERVSQPLVTEDKFADCIGELFVLLAAFEPVGAHRFASRNGRTHSFDRIGSGTKLVCGHMRHHRRLSRRVCSIPGSAVQLTRHSHSMATRCAGLRHLELAACPGPYLRDCLARSQIRRLLRFEEVQHVLSTRSASSRWSASVSVPPWRMVTKRRSRCVGRITAACRPRAGCGA